MQKSRQGLRDEGNAPIRIVVWYDDGHTEECPTPDQAGWRQTSSENVVCVAVLWNKEHKAKYFQDILIDDPVTGSSRFWLEPSGGAEWYAGQPDDIPQQVPQLDIKTQGATDPAIWQTIYNLAHEGVPWP